MWVYDEASETMVSKDITFVPGLYKIFDEILGECFGFSDLFLIMSRALRR